MNEKWRLFAIMILTYDDSDIQINGKHYELKKEYVFRKRVLFISFYLSLILVNFFILPHFGIAFILKVVYYILFNLFCILFYPIFSTFFFPKTIEDTFDIE